MIQLKHTVIHFTLLPYCGRPTNQQLIYEIYVTTISLAIRLLSLSTHSKRERRRFHINQNLNLSSLF